MPIWSRPGYIVLRDTTAPGGAVPHTRGSSTHSPSSHPSPTGEARQAELSRRRLVEVSTYSICITYA